MSRASDASFVSTGGLKKPYPTVFQFLCRCFPKISNDLWKVRLDEGLVFYDDGIIAKANDLCKPSQRIWYYREIDKETPIPFEEKILYVNDHILIADKPHFLPVIPAGRFVNETLLNRLKQKTGLVDLTPVNRIDRETAGLVLFSTNRKTAPLYYDLFKTGSVQKVYRALSPAISGSSLIQMNIENRLVSGEPWFLMKVESGIPNARSTLTIENISNGICSFSVVPHTGKKHQIRIHMASVGYPILNDRYYPVLAPQGDDDYVNPLKLLSEQLRFIDPITKESLEFRSGFSL